MTPATETDTQFDTTELDTEHEAGHIPADQQKLKLAKAKNELAEIPVSKIHAAADNVRDDLGDIDGLAASIREVGLLQPVTVIPHPDIDGDYLLVAGHRRHAAAQLAKLKTVPAYIRADLAATKAGDQARIAAMLVENLQRRNLTPIEEARGYAQLAAMGWSQREIAARCGFTQAHVSRRVALQKLPADIIAMISPDRLRLDDAVAVARHTDNPRFTTWVEQYAAVIYNPDQLARSIKALGRAIAMDAELAAVNAYLTDGTLEQVTRYPHELDVIDVGDYNNPRTWQQKLALATAVMFRPTTYDYEISKYDGLWNVTYFCPKPTITEPDQTDNTTTPRSNTGTGNTASDPATTRNTGFSTPEAETAHHAHQALKDAAHDSIRTAVTLLINDAVFNDPAPLADWAMHIYADSIRHGDELNITSLPLRNLFPHLDELAVTNSVYVAAATLAAYAEDLADNDDYLLYDADQRGRFARFLRTAAAWEPTTDIADHVQLPANWDQTPLPDDYQWHIPKGGKN